jgi:chromosome segregation protein
LHLKTLSLIGFKSFADRTRLDFERGVNVIVGPNGSGKSNIVDAISWVMGTQATTTLRTSKMDDVIFSGTATRPALPRAEVNLTFENSEGLLPVDLPEVTITRRLHRDGTSDYEINGTPCRLLDIQELLADSHVGRHQHVIVAQGRIDSILSASPQEQRAVIEEAAGVVKHRNRRDRSIRRLEQTGEDMKRLKDILHEQQKLMRPLRRQAEAAERHDEMKATARSLRLFMGGTTLRSIRERLAADESEQATLQGIVEAAASELAEISASLRQLEAAAGDAGSALERDTAAAARLETTAERLHGLATVARERRLAIESQQRDASARRRDLELELQAMAEETRQSGEAERVARAHAERAAITLQALEDEERSFADQDQLPAEGVVAALRGDLRALEAADERDRRESESLAHRIDVVRSRIVDEGGEIERIDVETRAADAEVGAAQDAYAAAKERRSQAQLEWERAEEDGQRASFELTRARARIEAIEVALAGITDPGSRDHAASFDAVVGTVMSRLDVPEPLTAAVIAALGPWVDALATRDHGGVEAVIAGLKADGMGGVPLVSVAEEDAGALARTRAVELGIDALVDRLGPDADEALAATLLGDVLLLEGWSAAWRVVGSDSSLRAVTPEGDLITSFGVKPADPQGVNPAALEDAVAALSTVERDVARADSRVTSTRRTFEQTRDVERAALESLEVLEARIAGSTEAAALLQRRRAESEAEATRLDDRLQAINEASVARAERLRELRRRLDDLEGDTAAGQEAWEALNRRRSEVTAKREQTRHVREEATRTLAAIEERRRLLEKRAVEMREALAIGDDLPSGNDSLDRLAGVEQEAQRTLAIARGHIEALRERQRTLREKAGSAGGRLSEAHSRQRELEVVVSESKDRLSELAVEIAELRVRNEAEAEALRRDVDATEEEALAVERPDGIDPEVDLEDRLDALEAELKRMGPINPLAAAEYRELSEKAEFLENQLADLEESRTELKKVISALDQKIGVLFREAFDEIASLFEENFALLFPGGKGRLSLTHPDDPLETGVELGAQPLGKKVSHLTLLSGGERSLAALAFLFAVFRARPSPFYILDEVEAALDDANLRRFLRLVQTLHGRAQLAVITHQQQTMEAGDLLYGVTMEPGESSQVIAQRLSEVGAQPRPAA